MPAEAIKPNSGSFTRATALPRWRIVLDNLLTSGLATSDDIELLRRLRMLNVTVILLFVVAAFWAFSFASRGAWGIGGVIAAVSLCGLGMLVWLRRATDKARALPVAAHFVMIPILVAVTLANWWTGGLAGANATTYFVIPLLSIILIGAWGLIWVAISMVLMGVLQYLTSSGYSFPNVIPEGDRFGDMAATWIIFFSAITGFAYQYESARRAAAKQVTAAKERAEAANQAKSQFLANVSHEIRTPLNGILGMTELALATQLSQEQRSYLDVALASTRSLLKVISDILDFSKVEAGKLDFESVEFSPAEVVQEVVAMLAIPAAQKGLRLERFLDPGLPGRLLGDPNRLRQVLMNLVGNAVKFTERGEVNLRVEREGDTVPPGVCLRFVVADTGIGIPRERQNAIFEPFTQADGSTTRRYGGTGLGLTIASRLVSLMGGRIGLESEEGTGSTFFFTACFRLAPLRATAGGAGASTLRDALKADALPLRVLVVEDDAVSERVVTRMVERLGHQVVVARTGREAIESAGSLGCDTVLMDLQMPDMDGFEATRQIREAEKKGDRRVQIIAVTARAMPQDREQCLQAGMDGYLSKPVHAEELRLALSACQRAGSHARIEREPG